MKGSNLSQENPDTMETQAEGIRCHPVPRHIVIFVQPRMDLGLVVSEVHLPNERSAVEFAVNALSDTSPLRNLPESPRVHRSKTPDEGGRKCMQERNPQDHIGGSGRYQTGTWSCGPPKQVTDART